MAQLNVRIDDFTRTDLDSLAAARGVGTTELVRSLIDTALGREEPEGSYDGLAPAGLSAVERQRLALQHRILGLLSAQPEERRDGSSAFTAGRGGHDVDLERLADGDPAHHARLVEILEQGYTAEYHRVFAGITRELTAERCALVHDVLDMFRVLAFSWEHLGEAGREQVRGDQEYAEQAVVFAGFDFNDPVEAKLAGYAQHLITDGRWSALAEHFDERHERGNSHALMVPTYQRMLTAFRPIWRARTASGGRRGRDGYSLDAHEIKRVLAAWLYRT